MGIVPISASVASGAEAPAAAPTASSSAPTDGLIGQYLFTQGAGTTVANSATGPGAVGDATVVNGTDDLWNGDSLSFIGGDKSSPTANWVELPDDILAGKESASITTEVQIDASMKSNFNFLWNIGNDANTTYYFSSVRDEPRTAITVTSGGGEFNARATAGLDAGRWYNLTSVIDGDAGTISFYIDGKLITTTPTTLTPASIEDQSLNAIGRSPWPDPFFKGEVAAFRVYDRALTASEISDVSDADAVAHADEFGPAAQAIADSITPVTVATTNPALPDYNGTVTWASNLPELTIGDDGRLASAIVPKAGEPDVKGTLTATASVRGVTATKTVDVTIKAPPADSDSWGNPVVQTIYTADPAPLVVGDTFYLYTGHDEDNSVGRFVMNDWHVFSSTDMANWTHHGPALSVSTFAWAKSDAWAGQAIERDGKFYWYVPTTETATGQMAIGVAVADSPVGPFRDALGHPLVSRTQIDPTVFIDDDGQAHLYWGNPDLYHLELNADMISYDGEPQKIELTAEGYGTRPNNVNRPTLYEEGPWVYKRNGTYYNMFAAECCGEFLAYSTAPTPTGPWTYGGAVMPRQGASFTNHGGVVDFKGKSYLVYHNGALPGGSGFTRSVAIEEFEYNADGSIPEMNMTTAGTTQVQALDPFQRQEAETISWESGVEVAPTTGGGLHVTDVDNRDYIKVNGADFGAGADTFTARVAPSQAGHIEVRLGSRAGTLVATCDVPSGSGDSQDWIDVTCPVTGATGTSDVFFVFTGDGSGDLFDIDSWQFTVVETDLELASSAAVRCVAGKAQVVVTVRNLDTVPADAVIRTPFGTKTVAVAAGAAASTSFATRLASITSGTATLTGTAADGQRYEGSAPIPPRACG
ncbi:family 43 glycosylhydrolase [Agromyces albus]|uniref:family 43 glycosylhydrolase n=1 Tax=Agromyces albus TaxID=205332 RepID=UPI002786E551|nr:family 43 glycosylhydrolase [Agromyces albus]MDQ0574107.1 hypothetical protein [Agromyces albus]